MKLSVLFVLLISSSSFATKFPCPKEIKTKQSIVNLKKNWQSFADPQGTHFLRGVDFYSGHPKDMAQLAPDNKDTNENPFWTFVPKDEIWQVCLYQDTNMRLVKKLGKSLKRCDLKYSKMAMTPPQIDSIECQ